MIQRQRSGSEVLVGAGLIERKSNLETGSSWTRLDIDVAGVPLDNTLRGVESQSQPTSWGLGGEERFEDAALEIGFDAGACVPDLDEGHLSL